MKMTATKMLMTDYFLPNVVSLYNFDKKLNIDWEKEDNKIKLNKKQLKKLKMKYNSKGILVKE
jgi:uncharacterized protein YpuA (DUF1002 family)